MSCYGSRINQTPNLDRIANGGIRFDNCFCTNSICTPSRATILTGTYNHLNGVTTLDTPMDNTLLTFPKLLQEGGYQTAIFGKWHLGIGPAHCPTGFDDWAVLPGQGRYHNPEFIFKGPDGGTWQTVQGYATDIITDMSLDWLRARDSERPFCLLCHHKAPHRPWYSDEKHAAMYLNEEIAEPDTLYDTYENRATAAAAAEMRVGPQHGFDRSQVRSADRAARNGPGSGRISGTSRTTSALLPASMTMWDACWTIFVMRAWRRIPGLSTRLTRAFPGRPWLV